MGRREIRRQRERLVIIGERRVEPGELHQRVRDVVVRARRVRGERRDALVVGDRFLGPAQSSQRTAQVGVRLGIVGPQRRRTLERRRGFGKPSARAEHDAEVIVRLGHVGPERHRTGEDVGRVGPAELMGHDPEPVERGDMSGVRRADLPVEPLGLRQPSGLMVRHRLRENLIGRGRKTGTHCAQCCSKLRRCAETGERS